MFFCFYFFLLRKNAAFGGMTDSEGVEAARKGPSPSSPGETLDQNLITKIKRGLCAQHGLRAQHGPRAQQGFYAQHGLLEPYPGHLGDKRRRIARPS